MIAPPTLVAKSFKLSKPGKNFGRKEINPSKPFAIAANGSSDSTTLPSGDSIALVIVFGSMRPPDNPESKFALPDLSLSTIAIGFGSFSGPFVDSVDTALAAVGVVDTSS